MRYDFAPMEGVTGWRFRAAHSRFFGGVDRYCAPFFSPSQEHSYTNKAFADLLPAHNEGISLVPQLLTKRAEDFLWAAGELAQMGYAEVNLNLGCPSGTVTAKGKGSGFLAFPDQLDAFLDEVFSSARVRVSVKTRLGMKSAEEFGPLLEIYNKYPISELVIHPRVRQDFYKNEPNIAAFDLALAHSRNPVCYNGDLVTAADCAAFSARFPSVQAVMIGRGLVANPALLLQVRGGQGPEKETLRQFHDALYAAYCEGFGSAQNAMRRMKELWFYLIGLFAEPETYAKKLKKTTTAWEYEALVAAIFQNLTLKKDATAVW